MLFKIFRLAVLFILIAVVGSGCNMPGPTIGQARDRFATGENDEVLATGKVVSKYVHQPTEDEEGASETVSYKIVDGQGVEFFVLSTLPLEEGKSYDFSFGKDKGFVCSESDPCVYKNVKRSDFNYWILVLPITFLYFIGFFVTRHYYYSTRSLILSRVISVLFPWPPLPPDPVSSAWCDEARPGKTFLYIEKVNVRKRGREYVMDIVPESHEVVPKHDGLLVALISERNAALVQPDLAQVRTDDTTRILTPDIDSNKSSRVWSGDDVDLIPLTSVPSWFGPNLVLQCWFDSNNRRTVYVRGGMYKVADVGLDRPRFGDQMHIGTGDGNYNPMPQTWTRLKLDEYIVITKGRDDADQLVSFTCPQQPPALQPDEATQASWEELAAQDGFYRVKIKCG